MKIIRLSFKNINSLAGQHTIRFDEKPLSSTGIFAITGPTGAGKSTLLDAITLAIYNQTPRTGKVSKNAIAEQGIILTRNMDDAFAEVEFQIKGETYRSKWAIRKTRNHTLADYEMELSQLKDDGKFHFVDNGLKKSDIPDKNSEIIGLNFDQFVKSILLSQGEFSRFLQAKPKERSELLERITGMEIYKELGMATFEKRKEEEEILNRIKSGTELLQPKPAEEMNALTSEQKELTDASKELEKKQISYQTEINLRKTITEQNQIINRAQVKRAELEKVASDLKPDLDKLAVHSQVFNYKSECETLLNGDIEVVKLNATNDRHSQKIKVMAPKLEELVSLKEKYYQHYTDQEADYKTWQPKIKEARRLDKEISNGVVELRNANNALAETKKRIDKQLNDNGKLANSIAQFKRDIDQLERVLKGQENYENLADVISKLSHTIESIQPDSKAISQTLTANDKWQIKTLLQNLNWDEATLRLHTQAAEYKQKERSLLDSRKELSTLSSDDLDKRKKEAEQLLIRLKYLKELASKYASLISEIETIEADIKTKQKLVSGLDKELAKNIELREKTEADLRIEEALWERASLEKKYDVDRLKLEEGEKCYLCGSTHHPFKKEAPESNLLRIETKITDLKKRIEEIKKVISETEVNKQSTLNHIQTRKEDNQKHLMLQANLTAEFKERVASLCFTINNENSISNEILKRETEIANIDKIDKLDKALNQLTLEQEQLNYLKLKVDQVITLKLKAKALVKPFKNVVSDPNKLKESIKELTRIAEKYRADKKHLEKLIAEKESDTKLLANGEKHLTDYKTTESEQTKSVASLTAKTDRLKATRQKTIETNDIDAFEESKATQLDNTRKKVTEMSESATVLEKELNTLKHDLTTNSNRLDYIGKNKQKLINTIQPILESMQLKDYKEALALLLPLDVADRIKSDNQKLDRERTENNHSFEEATKRKETLQKQLLFNEDDSQLSEMQQVSNAKLKEIQERSGSISQIFKEEEAKKTQLGAIAEQIESQQTIVDRWRRLQNVIGDAQGAKFSQLAQDMTLVFMLQHANSYLQQLSGRYQIKHDRQKENQKDDLWIIDQWQGFEERSVQTLSGGESFLVSLSLALGLSDLAGKKTKIESLFIDEGFGTLDQETLELALDTLQKLQYETNRTIGIISHVPALKERISTQIEIIKSASGHSSIRVV